MEVHEVSIGGDFIVSVSPFYDLKEKLMGSVNVARDISGIKSSEAEVKKYLKEKRGLFSVADSSSSKK